MSESFLRIIKRSNQYKTHNIPIQAGTLWMGTNLKPSGDRGWKWSGGPDGGDAYGTWEWFFSPVGQGGLNTWSAILRWDPGSAGFPEIYASLEGNWSGAGMVPHIPWFSSKKGGNVKEPFSSASAFKNLVANGFVFDWKPK